MLLLWIHVEGANNDGKMYTGIMSGMKPGGGDLAGLI